MLANPGSEVMKKLDKSKAIKTIGQEWIFLTVDDAVKLCSVDSDVADGAGRESGQYPDMV